MMRARQGLGIKLRAIIQKVFGGVSDSRIGVAQVQDEGFTRRVKIMANAVMSPKNVPSLLLVSFEDETDRAVSADLGIDETPSSTDSNSMVQQLEGELQATREDLQSTVEEMESSNEELKAANEEVMSVNEELQSTNEELETSK